MGTITAVQAAAQARVSIRTIHSWCHRGAVTATKQAGRWVIDSSSLLCHVALVTRKRTTYRLEQESGISEGHEYTFWRIALADGTASGHGPGKDPRLAGSESVFHRKETAAFHLRFYEETDSCYHIRLRRPPARSISPSPWWEITGGEDDDPAHLKRRLPVTRSDTYALSTCDVLIMWAQQHAAGATARVIKHGQRKLAEAAEAAARRARAKRLAEAARLKGPLATDRQVDYILTLLARRERNGECGGSFAGPTTRAGLEEMSRSQASACIVSLTDTDQ
ncbi:hypothetical protein [Streptomyces sp. NPDC007088]|uniref:hypothetical protein n=1 Tax=Streptomyces sp. NPDC007088 TaxID=3364773 RepID=UPI0036904D9C